MRSSRTSSSISRLPTTSCVFQLHASTKIGVHRYGATGVIFNVDRKVVLVRESHPDHDPWVPHNVSTAIWLPTMNCRGALPVLRGRPV